MSIYDKASLVLIPSGTKTSKVYSQKPTNGDGDFTFSRSTAATRVNASGNIEKETQNLLNYSNNFGASYWLNNAGSCTRTGGQSGYDGTSDAWLLTQDGAGFDNILSNSTPVSGVYTFSVYAKANTGNTKFTLRAYSTTSRSEFNLTTGTIAASSGVIDDEIVDVGGGWYRCSATFNASSDKFQIYPQWNSSSPESVYIQDAQLEQGLVARDYIETTTTAIYGGITDNVPRLDYTDSSCPALLLEPQRTNLVPQSEYLGSSEWNLLSGGTGVAPTLSYGYESPEGLNNAYEVTFNSGAGTTSSDQSVINDNIGGQAAGNYTLSFWAKVSSGTDKIIARSAGGYLYTTCNLTTEWQRFEITENLASAGSIYVEIGLRRGLANEPLNSSVTCQIYGIQLEAGSYATSYIPTYGSAVTRNQDTLQLTGMSSDVASGATSGTLMIEFDYTQQSFGDVIQWYSSSTATGRGYLYNRSLGFADTWGSAGLGTTDGVNTKVIWRLDSLSSGTFFKDGVKGNDVDTTTQAWNNIDNLFIRGHYGTINVRQIIFVPYALSNQEAIDLTTL